MVVISKVGNSSANKKQNNQPQIIRKQSLSKISEEGSENIDDSKNDEEEKERSESVESSIKKQMCEDVSQQDFKDQFVNFTTRNEKSLTMRFVPEIFGHNKQSIL